MSVIPLLGRRRERHRAGKAHDGRRPHLLLGSGRSRRDWLAGYTQGKSLRRALTETLATVAVLVLLTALLTFMQAGGGQ